MKKQRPTIPIAEWKVATHLQATREIQNQPGVSAYNCDCEWCVAWQQCFRQVLPKALQLQLTRVGVKLSHPTDLYLFDKDTENASLRVVYHAVGKILEGPNVWKSCEEMDMLMYSILSEQPYVSMVVIPQCQTHGTAPVLPSNSDGELIRIDFRLQIPLKLKQ